VLIRDILVTGDQNIKGSGFRSGEQIAICKAIPLHFTGG
jgi:hypothetical protein